MANGTTRIEYLACKECGRIVEIDGGLCTYGCSADSVSIKERAPGTLETLVFQLLERRPYIPEPTL